jgi:Co/Zn/Cd efflux system component
LCLIILEKNNDKKENHIRASIVFSSIDIWANIGSIISATLILILKGNMIPDLVVSIIIFCLILWEAIEIFVKTKKN